MLSAVLGALCMGIFLGILVTAGVLFFTGTCEWLLPTRTPAMLRLYLTAVAGGSALLGLLALVGSFFAGMDAFQSGAELPVVLSQLLIIFGGSAVVCPSIWFLQRMSERLRQQSAPWS